MGRPPIPYNPEVADAICEMIATTALGLEDVLTEVRKTFPETPGLSTVYKWLNSEPAFANNSARARELQGIGTVTRDSTKNGKETRTSDNVERSKLIVQTLLKRAGQLAPKKYGDRLIHAGDAENPVVHKIDREEVIAKLIGNRPDTSAE
jgi:hypothetical protein